MELKSYKIEEINVLAEISTEMMTNLVQITKKMSFSNGTLQINKNGEEIEEINVNGDITSANLTKLMQVPKLKKMNINQVQKFKSFDFMNC